MTSKQLLARRTDMYQRPLLRLKSIARNVLLDDTNLKQSCPSMIQHLRNTTLDMWAIFCT